mgnify:CR=1 FL=1
MKLNHAVKNKVRGSAHVLVALCIVLTSNAARSSEAMLNQFFAEVDTLAAVFTQRIVDDSGMTLDAAGGRVYLSRPGKFRWDYFSPGQADLLEQQIIADGDAIFVYDLDLEQVTRRSLDNALSQIPSLSLVESKATVDEHFEVFDVGVTDGVSWVALKPKDPDAGFNQIMVGFENAVISAISMLDVLGNETRLDLRGVELNAQLEMDVFEFTVPEGVDVLEQ